MFEKQNNIFCAIDFMLAVGTLAGTTWMMTLVLACTNLFLYQLLLIKQTLFTLFNKTS